MAATSNVYWHLSVFTRHLWDKAMKIATLFITLLMILGCASQSRPTANQPLPLRNGSYFIEAKTLKEGGAALARHCGDKKVVVNAVVPPENNQDGMGIVFDCR